MKNNELMYIEDLKKVYENVGYKLTYNEEGLYCELYFGNSTSPNMLVKVIDEYGSSSSIKETLELFESNKLNCKQYKAIYLKGYDLDSAYIYSEYNMVIVDQSEIEAIKDNLTKYGEHLELFNYNKQSIHWAKMHLEKSKKVSINNATGLGKTVVIKELLKSNTFSSILYLAPSDAILKQSRAMLTDISNIDYMTYSKLHYNKHLCSDKYDLVILDEYHRVGASKWQLSIKELLANNSDSYLIGLTATFVRFLDNARDMRAELFGDAYIPEITLHEALAKEILTPPTYINSIASINYEKESLIEKINSCCMPKAKKEELISKVNNYCEKWETNVDIPALIKKYASGNKSKFIVFCKNIKHLHDVEELVSNWFKLGFDKPVNVYKIYTGVSDKSNILKEFKDSSEEEISLLFTIDILNEGVHMDVDGLIFLRETTSPIIYYQQLGRALQTNHSSQTVVFDFVSNFANIVASSLSSEYNEALSLRNIRRQNVNLKPLDFNFHIINNHMEIVNFFDSIYRKIGDIFTMRYEELKCFYKQNGHCRVPTYKYAPNTPLANWCSKTRTQKKKGLLKSEEIEKLDLLNFTWDVHEEMWNSKYESMKHHLKFNLPTTKELDNWVNNQKKDFKSGRLSNEKIQKVKSLGISLERKDKTVNLDWYGMYDLVLDYIDIFGKKPATNSEHKGYKIGVWLANQKYTLRTSNDLDKLSKIESIGVKVNFEKELLLTN